MWTFDRSRTSYDQSVDAFIEAVGERTSERVFAKLSTLLNVSLESVTNTYATPMFQLGIAYKHMISKYLMGKTEVIPNAAEDLNGVEFRLTETAELYRCGLIDKQTLMLINMLRFQFPNSTFERSRFERYRDAKVMPLLFTIQVLNELEQRDMSQAYIEKDELGWLGEETEHTDIQGFTIAFLSHRAQRDIPPQISSGSDVFFNLFGATGVIKPARRVPLDGRQKNILVLALNRRSVTDRVLQNPPSFIDITWEDRRKWALNYVRVPENLKDYLPVENPVYVLDLSHGSTFHKATYSLNVPTALGAQFTRNDYFVISGSFDGLAENAIYKVLQDPTFKTDGTAVIPIKTAYLSYTKDIKIGQSLKTF